MPFGSGQRACIGRHFSFYESQLLLGLILQRFRLLDSFDYQLEIKDFFSIKPDNLTITVGAPRRTRSRGRSPGPRAAARQPKPGVQAAAPARVVSDYGGGNPLLVLYGSNLGTSERIANEIAEDGRARGFAVTQGALNDYVDALPTDGLVVICTSSYNGNPPDNAVEFHRWLGGGLAPDALAGVNYTVFGAGDRVWASTFQKVPAEIDEMLAGGRGDTLRAARGRRCLRRLRRHVPRLVRGVLAAGRRRAGPGAAGRGRHRYEPLRDRLDRATPARARSSPPWMRRHTG